MRVPIWNIRDCPEKVILVQLSIDTFNLGIGVTHDLVKGEAVHPRHLHVSAERPPQIMQVNVGG